MGTDDIFKIRRQQRQKRKKEYLKPKVNSFLIVTEGKCTEPYYFEGIEKLIAEKVGGIVDIVAAPKIDIIGKGMSSMKLVDATSEIVKNAKVMYQNIWVVFDKDDFEDFDEAIIEGKRRGYNIAWTNQAFEYWLYLHFHYSDSALHRDDWNKKLDILFKEYNLREKGYEKNDKDLFNLLNEFRGPQVAIKNAKRRMSKYKRNEYKPSDYDPGTTVHLLVEALLVYLEE